jgi:hypothetical protein
MPHVRPVLFIHLRVSTGLTMLSCRFSDQKEEPQNLRTCQRSHKTTVIASAAGTKSNSRIV